MSRVRASDRLVVVLMLYFVVERTGGGRQYERIEELNAVCVVSHLLTAV